MNDVRDVTVALGLTLCIGVLLSAPALLVGFLVSPWLVFVVIPATVWVFMLVAVRRGWVR